MSILDGNFALISSRKRIIGTIVPDVIVEEVQTDTLAITDHPVEKGAAISDHAFKLPSEVEMRVGFSNAGGGEGYVQQVYEEFLALQKARQPFDVTTGKRAYTNMLVKSITVVTDQKSEFALNASISLREIIIVETKSTGSGASSDRQQQSGPQTTSNVETGGPRSAIGADGAPTFDQTKTIKWDQLNVPYGGPSGAGQPAGRQWPAIG